MSNTAAVTLDEKGNIYVVGRTASADFQTRHAFQPHPGASPLLATGDEGTRWTSMPIGSSIDVRSIASSPSSPSVMYAATDIGVWKSADAGATWSFPSNYGLITQPVAVSVDAASPSLVYVATSSGMFVSTDGGTSWTLSDVGINLSSYNPAFGAAGVNIVAHPAKPGIVFAMTQDTGATSLFRSSDSGKTWAPAPVGAFVQVLVADPRNPSTLYVAGESSGMFKSTDGGDSWFAIAHQASDSLVIDPSNSAILYSVNAGNVWKSSDGGQTFVKILAGLDDGLVDYSGEKVALDPRNPSSIYVTAPFVLYRSSDGGGDWSKVPIPARTVSSLLVSSVDSRVFAGAAASSDAFISKWSPDGSQLLYATYLGGTGNDSATAVAVDADGNAYVLGVTASPDFPVSSNAPQKKLIGLENAFVVKVSQDGSQLLYSTFLGGGGEAAGGIAVDSSGSVVVTGSTQSNFPVTPGAIRTTPGAVCVFPGPGIYQVGGSAFVTKLSPDGGSFVYSTLLGGTTCSSSGFGVAVADNGDAWIAGTTSSSGDFPVTPDALQIAGNPGDYDGFLTRLDPSGRLVYSTFVGGKRYDSFTGIALDKDGSVYLTGSSAGFSQSSSVGALRSLPSVPACGLGSIGGSRYYPAGDFFVMKMDSTGKSITALSYLGAGTCSSSKVSIAVDQSGSPWIAGMGNFVPAVGPFRTFGLGFVSKFNSDLTKLDFSTQFDPVGSIALDALGAAYLAGQLSDVYLPVQAVGGVLGIIEAPFPVYIAKIDGSASEVSLDTVTPGGPMASGNQPGYSLPIAAGEVLQLTGANLGPASPQPGSVDPSGYLATYVGGVEVTFDGLAAPLLSVSNRAIQCIAPFELAGTTKTSIVVRNGKVKSNEVLTSVVPLALNTLAVLNDDFTANSPSNPAKPGSIITAYISGAGQTNPPSSDGQMNTPPYGQPGIPLNVGFGNDNYIVTFAGAAPGLAAGILQVSFIAPNQSTPNVHIAANSISTYFNLAIR